MRGVLLSALALLASLAHAQPSGNDSAQATRESETRYKIEQIRGEIKALTRARRVTSDEREESVRDLREKEIAIGAAAKALHELDAKLAEQQHELDALETQRTRLADALRSQREGLADLLRSAYMLGHDEELKLLLQQEDGSSIARVLAYHRYFERARIVRIDALLRNLGQLADVRKAITAKTRDLAATRAVRATDSARLDAERDQRRKLLAELDATLKDQSARIAVLGKNEKALNELLEKLRDVFADIPQQLSGAQPFASLRGRLEWPLRGKLMTAFGAVDSLRRKSAGWLIGAKAGSAVHAVSYGRVAFADWFRGYGLLMIIDHGDGYLSLYGYNEALLKDVGDWVRAGETVAESGASGGQPSAGVYFELRHRSQPIDPRAWLKPAPGGR
ncbi:MAG: peptidoglycan DD-metalloendopeptidase family protein [Rhodanobacteraceae bacterium]